MRPRFAGGTVDLRPEEIVRLEEGRVVLLDQRRLPDEEVELECRSAAEVAEAIRAMAVRGAPAIGVAAAYGYALAAANGEDLGEAAEVLVSARPTAFNLPWAIAEMQSAEGDLAERARDLHRAEVERCRRMGDHAAGLFREGSTPLTHCNAGGLATGGYGSALGALKAGFERGLVNHVFVDETRPLLQGARLTAWELERAGIPASVIADSAAASLMGATEISHVVTGADRIARNGDTANKIGTYALAVLAAHHDIPFYVVAPTSTLDRAAATGADIPIEERDPAEVSERFEARNPAFDVTPAALITAIVTEEGVHERPYEESLPSPRRGQSRALPGESPAGEETEA
jgi:methylthioribose-1-phosphate isomerase